MNKALPRAYNCDIGPWVWNPWTWGRTHNYKGVKTFDIVTSFSDSLVVLIRGQGNWSHLTEFEPCFWAYYQYKNFQHMVKRPSIDQAYSSQTLVYKRAGYERHF